MSWYIPLLWSAYYTGHNTAWFVFGHDLGCRKKIKGLLNKLVGYWTICIHMIHPDHMGLLLLHFASWIALYIKVACSKHPRNPGILTGVLMYPFSVVNFAWPGLQRAHSLPHWSGRLVTASLVLPPVHGMYNSFRYTQLLWMIIFPNAMHERCHRTLSTLRHFFNYLSSWGTLCPSSLNTLLDLGAPEVARALLCQDT